MKVESEYQLAGMFKSTNSYTIISYIRGYCVSYEVERSTTTNNNSMDELKLISSEIQYEVIEFGYANDCNP